MTKGTVRTATGRRPYGTGLPVCGRLFCKTCGRWRLLLDFPAEKKTTRGTIVRWASECRTCLRIRQRNNRADPVRRAARREYDRIWYERKRRAAGIAPRKIGPDNTRPEQVGTGHGDVVPANALLAYVERWMRCHCEGWAALAVKTHIDQRTWSRVRASGRCHISTADRALIALNGPALAELYPYPEIAS